MGKASRIKRRALKSRGRVRRDGGSYGYYSAVAAVCIVGIALVAVTKAQDSSADETPRANVDHWHAAIAINVCGTWLPNPAEFEQRSGDTSLRAGIHTHGDGLMHIHPFSGDESGENATVGTFLDFGGWDVGTDFVDGWDNTRHEDGDDCGEGDDAEEAMLRWTVDGEEIRGNPANYKPVDQTTIGIYFVPADEDLEALEASHPSKAQLADPLAAEEGREPGVTTVPGSDTTVPTGTTVAGSGTTVDGSGSSTTAAPTTVEATTTTP